MSSKVKMNAWTWLAVAGLPAIVVAQPQTLSFQNGVNGYTGTFDIGISDCTTGQVPEFQDGSLVPRFEIDGYGTNDSGVQNSWNRIGLFRFDHIIGYEPGQIPPNATILSARLELFTTTTSNDQSPGPIGVARLLKPFDLNTRWTDPFGPEGPDFHGGDFDRPVGGYEGCAQGSIQSTDVSPIVQAWVNGEPNHGFIVMIGNTADAWACGATGNAQVARRPKLVVEFIRMRSRQIVFQQDVNGYTGASMLRMLASGTTELGTVHATGAYVDGGDARADALIRFDGVFGTGPNQIAPNATILKAYLTLTTLPEAGFPGGSVNAPSRGRFDIHRLLVPVDWEGDGGEPFLWGEFLSGDGPTEADGEIGPTLVSAEGLIWNSRPPLDITSTVQAWQSGEPNYGLILTPGTHDTTSGSPPVPTNDGWKIHWTGSSPELRPQLIVLVPSARADISGDGYVNETDMDLFEACAATSGPAIPHAGGCASADLDGDADVDQSDYGILQACFSGTQIASSECR